ncbi:MAG: DUF4269 domain-containing protein [Gammaproteobacteria bacterium]|nr:DUF4269 domain-containing protein [Gammaproteobacteria bacterium]
MQRREAAMQALQQSSILGLLDGYSPTVVSTLWVDLATESSDIDVICEFHDPIDFKDDVQTSCQQFEAFHINSKDDWVLASFEKDAFQFEIYGCNVPVKQQAGYQHFRVMQRLTMLGGVQFCEAVKFLKRQGLKTEPAIARLLGLSGDAYQAVAALEQNTDKQLIKLWQNVHGNSLSPDTT